jgi:4-hydroxy-2-oxoglutarate aldolase
LALAAPLPEKCVELFHLFKAGHHGEAQTLQQHLALASKTIVSDGGIAGVKHAMDLRGYHGGLPRLPLLPLADAKKTQIAHLLARFEPTAARV